MKKYWEFSATGLLIWARVESIFLKFYHPKEYLKFLLFPAKSCLPIFVGCWGVNINVMVLTVGYPAVSTRFALSELKFSRHEALAAATGHRAPDGLQQNERKTPPELLSYALASHKHTT